MSFDKEIIKGLKADITKLKITNKRLKLETKDINKLKQEITRLKIENINLNVDGESINKLKQENASLKQENASLKQENASLKQENASLKQENVVINKLNLENENLKQEIKGLLYPTHNVNYKIVSGKITHFKLNNLVYYGILPWSKMLELLVLEYKNKKCRALYRYDFKIITIDEFTKLSNNTKSNYQYYIEYERYINTKHMSIKRAYSILKKICNDKKFALDIEIELADGGTVRYCT
jgi:predicted RNase H-like nuclease (RuvC/YqgF family)